MAAVAMLSALSFAPAARAVPAEALEPLLRVLSMRPWWGDPPAVAFAGLDGQRRSLADRKGRVVLLYFWATW